MAANETGLLAVETAYYDEHTEQLLLTHPNRFLLISGDAVIGDYERHSEAVAEGVRRYGANRDQQAPQDSFAPPMADGVPDIGYRLGRGGRGWRGCAFDMSISLSTCSSKSS